MSDGKIQGGWASCPKCQGMHFAGFPFKGVCPADQLQHEQTGSFAYAMIFDSPPGDHIQLGWASCPKCQGMHFAGFPDNKGFCPADHLQHSQTGSFAYAMKFGVSQTDNVQVGWRACPKCQGLFFGPFNGKCPRGGEHSVEGSFEYAMQIENPAMTLRAVADRGRFIEVTGHRFTRNRPVKLGYDIASGGGPTTHQIGEDTVSSDGTGGVIHRIQVNLAGDISGAQVQATDISGTRATASL